jgi:putative glycosyltransferase
MEQAVDAITSFSAKPLYIIFYLGMCISFFSVILFAYFVIRTLIWGNVLLGWTSIIALLLMLFGVIMMSIGILGIYLSRIFEEVKTRPHVIVRKIWRHEDIAL